MTKMKLSSFFAIFFCLATMGLYSDITDSSTGLTFPSEITVEHSGKQYKLQSTGVATRKKFFVKVYSVASYIQSGVDFSSDDKFQPFLSDAYAKQLTMKWVHEADPDKIQGGYIESFKNALSPSDFSRIQNDINQYVQYFNHPVQKGDEHILRSFPDGTVEVLMNGKTVGTINNKDFAKALWSIWFGNKSVVDRNRLVEAK